MPARSPPRAGLHVCSPPSSRTFPPALQGTSPLHPPEAPRRCHAGPRSLPAGVDSVWKSGVEGVEVRRFSVGDQIISAISYISVFECTLVWKSSCMASMRSMSTCLDLYSSRPCSSWVRSPSFPYVSECLRTKTN